MRIHVESCCALIGLSTAAQMRREVLRSYRLLQRACRNLFREDHEALKAARMRVKEEFWKNQSVTDQNQISQLVAKANEAEQYMRKNIVQAVNTGDNIFRVRMTSDTVLEDNAPLPKNLVTGPNQR